MEVIALVIGTVLVWAWWIKRRKRFSPFKGIPCAPDAHWLLGHIPHLALRNFEEGLKTLVDTANPNGRSCFWIGNEAAISVIHGRDAHMFLSVTSDRNLDPLFKRHYKRILGLNSPILINGKDWKLYRSAIHRAFSPQALKECQSSMNLISLRLQSSLIQRINSSPDGTVTMDVLPLVRMATMDFFGSIGMGIDFRCCENLTNSPVAYAFEFLSDETTRRIMSPFNIFCQFYSLPSYLNRRNNQEQFSLREFIRSLIKGRRNGDNSPSMKKGSDLLSNIIAAVDKLHGNEQHQQMKETLIEETASDLLMTLVFAGYDTTSITLAYALYLISAHPQVQELCVEEAISALGTDEKTIPADFNPEGKLHYIRAVLYETLRLFPSAPSTSRLLNRPIKLSDCELPADTKVFVPIWCIQRNPSNFPRPLEFLPERWARRKKINGNDDFGSHEWEERPEDDTCENSNDDYISPANREAFVAFSAGARNCVGKKLAIQESVTLLAILLRNLKFNTVPGYVPNPVRAGPIQKPERGMPMIIQQRHN